MAAVKPRRRDISAALTRKAVLEGALNLFVSKGFASTSIDEIARASESSNGAVYHHFRDKQEIFVELFRHTQAEVLRLAVEAMPADATAWQRVEMATRAFLHGYVADDGARALLRQSIGVLGWDVVRRLDEEQSLPLIRAILDEAIASGESKPVPVAAAADILFSLYCNSVVFIAASDDPALAASEAETVIFTLLGGMRVGPVEDASPRPRRGAKTRASADSRPNAPRQR